MGTSPRRRSSPAAAKASRPSSGSKKAATSKRSRSTSASRRKASRSSPSKKSTATAKRSRSTSRRRSTRARSTSRRRASRKSGATAAAVVVPMGAPNSPRTIRIVELEKENAGLRKANRGLKRTRRTSSQRPKRKPSAYMMFANTYARKQITSKNPDMRATEVAKEMGNMWRALPEAEKAAWKAKAAAA